MGTALRSSVELTEPPVKGPSHDTRSAFDFENVSRRFRGDRGMGPLRLTVRWGQVCSLIGSNGCGKTTLLRCASLFEILDSGLIRFDGETLTNSVTDRSTSAHKVHGSKLGTVFQNLEPWPHLRVLENIMLPLTKAGKLSAQEARQRAEEELERFGLADRSKSLSHQLSGGLRQRVVLARAFALRPRALLLDEVMSALDPDWSERVAQIIRDFADGGGAVIFVSHRLNVVRRLSDWIVYMKNGNIVEQGQPQFVLDAPQDGGLRKFLENA